jgi:alginate O-acetyltransferase complex protein AlgI
MLFNSSIFLAFFLIFFFLYWFATGNNLKKQNILILIGSYIFYGWWDWRFVLLLMLSTLIDYGFGLLIYNRPDRKKLFLWMSIFNNLAILGFFKYYNFFAESFRDMFLGFGIQTQPYILEILLPVGISFYTFHGMSYVIDIYYGRSAPTKNFVDYAVFVCFFPLLVAGPIERANHLLPQVVKPRTFNYLQAISGCQIILWGFFKKVVIADGLAGRVNYIFANHEELSSLTLIVGAVYFAIQIYCDFSGYSDIAIGVAKLLGFELLVNFRFPYFSRDIAEFWRRWHISLSSWFKDYLYIPLGGSQGGLAKSIRNTFIIFIVSGFWHGANWTFIVWGFLHALYFLPLLIAGKNRTHVEVAAAGKIFPSLKEATQIAFTFVLVCLAWIFFRAENLSQAFAYLGNIAEFTIAKDDNIYSLPLLMLVLGMFLIEWQCRHSNITYAFGLIQHKTVRHFAYYTVIMLIFMYGTFSETAFIYFQF